MRWQSTAVLAVIFVALGAFYYVYEIRQGPEREKAEARKGCLYTAELKDVVAVEMKRLDGTVRLKRDGDDWQILEPVKAWGDRGIVDGLVTTFVMARSDREVASNPSSRADFGLDKPAADVTLTFKD